MQIVEIIEKTFESESNDIALYLAMARKAEEEGQPEIASYLLEVAMDEAQHAVKFASLLGKVKDTKTNIATMLAGEMQAEKEKAKAAKIAQAEGQDDAFQFFNRSMRDERKHKTGLWQVLSKLHEKD